MVRLWRSFAKCIQFITFFFASQEGLNSFFFLFTEPCHGIMKWFGLEGALKITLFQPPYAGGRVTNYFFPVNCYLPLSEFCYQFISILCTVFQLKVSTQIELSPWEHPTPKASSSYWQQWLPHDYIQWDIKEDFNYWRA